MKYYRLEKARKTKYACINEAVPDQVLIITPWTDSKWISHACSVTVIAYYRYRDYYKSWRHIEIDGDEFDHEYEVANDLIYRLLGRVKLQLMADPTDITDCVSVHIINPLIDKA